MRTDENSRRARGPRLSGGLRFTALRAASLAARVVGRAQGWIARAMHGLADERASEQLTLAAYGKLRHYTEPWHQDLGLFDFEQEALDAWFPAPSARLLVPACGAGRELVALTGAGYQCVGAEPVAPLLAAARERLPNVPLARATLTQMAEAPEIRGPFDGVVVGWGAWGHVLRAEQRVQVLRSLRELCPTGPVLLSWRSEAVRGLRGWAHSTGALHAGSGTEPPLPRRFVRADGTVEVTLHGGIIDREARQAGYVRVVARVRGEAGYPNAVLLPS